jgi:transposase InsO family protein
MEVSEAKRLRELEQENARKIIADWREHYNNERPHSSLGYKVPRVFEQEAA